MIEIIPIPAFEDNYIWLIRNQAYAAVVDPGDADPVMEYLQQHDLKLTAILITHHHGDHCGGAKELSLHFNCPVYGPRREKITATTQNVAENDIIALPDVGAEFHVIDVPGHTRGHVAYYGINSLFCGDALFACGCGRLFEGTPEQMQASLAKLAALPDETKVFCAHEYTLDNIRFARIADPDNAALQERETRERQIRAQGLPTLPSTIALEKRTNPFLRWNDTHLIKAASQFAGRPLGSPASIFAAIRQWKDKLD
ncbi:MAG: hydroxyacylglutathione hydrolase [Sulfurimicrobium sp.]|nr:hydroxyacylglutathione hydrolase [Sulfurimicrobium sp.]MDP1705667.1 hydroxyacylglutathione hydrolase [Sulfurimicrobium sp.]MDP2199810.1 hydroxyacylglutathione hydrolase [Sulfurimicrobium sp.]MDP3687826.1 hydroxyacylglutathione hydrolase [Sulfurimicrobium sp.]